MNVIFKTIAAIIVVLSLAPGAKALPVQPGEEGPARASLLAPSALSWILTQVTTEGFSFDTFVQTAICRLTVGCGGEGAVTVAQQGELGLIEEDGGTYVFDTATGDRLLRLALAGDEEGLGTDVAGQSSVIAVGGVGADGAGSVYLFDASTGAALRQIADPSGTPGSGFGYSVALNGGSLLVGAPQDGLAYVFDAATGDLLHRLSPPTGLALDGFGSDVGFGDGLGGDVLSVAGIVTQPGGPATPGRFLFDRDTGSFLGQASATQTAGLTGGTGSSGGLSGGSSAVLAAPSLPAVPLPAPILLLLAALGSTVLWQRKFG